MSRKKTTFEFAGRGKERLYFRRVAAVFAEEVGDINK